MLVLSQQHPGASVLGAIVKRLLRTAALGLVATALSAPPAMAAPPEPVGGEGVVLSECGFDLLATRSGKVKFFGEGLKIVFPSQRVTFTNPDTGESATYVISGAFRAAPTDTALTLRFTGHNLILGGRLGILYTTGNQTFVDVDGTTTLMESHGEVVNVCEVLAP